MAWTEENLLKFMQVHSFIFGDDIKQILLADEDWICRRFTEKLFSALDWTQVINTPFVNVSYYGKGDVQSIKVKNDFCLTPCQCVNIANFISGRVCTCHHKAKLNDLDSFAILNYIQYDFDIFFDYIHILKTIIKEIND